jgi:hypothetical protein
MNAMDVVDAGLSPERRTRLAAKGRILYRKSCGAAGKRTCAESFALFHIVRGQEEVARDLLAFLETEAEALRLDDPDERLAPTEALAARIRLYLDSATKQPAEKYATLGEHDKKTVLEDVAQAQAVTSKSWAQTRNDLPAAEC